MSTATTGPDRCPHCDGAALRPVRSQGTTNLLCLECRRCWHPGDGGLVRVDSRTCAGCPDRRFCSFLVDGPLLELVGALQAAAAAEKRA